MIFLFIHQNFPAQYRHIARHLADRPDNTVYFVTQPNGNAMPGVKKITYQKPPRNIAGAHPLTIDLDEAILTGAAVADVCRLLAERGIRPDIVIGHCGWGETLFIKDVFPDVPVLTYFEFFYHSHGVDVGFDPEFISIFNEPSRLRVRNSVNLMGFDAADWGHTATEWQRGLYPAEMRQRITAIHEGVDTAVVRPNAAAKITLQRSDLVLTRKNEVVTYVSRNLEPYRGFHIFMRALPEILRRRKKAHVVIVGGDDISYGTPPPPGTTYRETLLREVGKEIDIDRVHFLGLVPYQAYLNILQVSSVHVYLTYPFVLSWSFVEALAAGCLVVGSATGPVLDVLRDGQNGLTVDFFSPRALADRVCEVFERRDRMQDLRDAARKTAVKRFDLAKRQLPRWTKLIDDVANGRRPRLDDNE
jgi:glycosyltransferase involved in cell wall biosynthesis